MSKPVYTSNVRIERIRGPLRSADIPAESEPVMFGVHAGVAEHYGVAPGTEAERATTLDYIVAAAGGWLTGTFGGALEARQVPASEGRLVGEIVGEIEAEDDGVIVIKRIHATYHLKVDADADRAKIQRAFDNHMPKCPVYRSISGSIDISSELVLMEA